MGKRIGGETVVGVSRVAIGMEKGARDDRGSGTAITPNQNQLWWQSIQGCASILCLQNKRTNALCCVQDFVKWKGPLFHKFTLSLVDSSPAVRRLAQYLLADTLALKVPLPSSYL